jgi:hypothetical protein
MRPCLGWRHSNTVDGFSTAPTSGFAHWSRPLAVFLGWYSEAQAKMIEAMDLNEETARLSQ